ncbi:MAG: ABC transporter ATP-binding protein [SAR324 cluster bacterium]|nr:ABC transporter ATP-binding protein [SAR324 cluster bacterium]
MAAMLEARQLTKSFGSVIAADQIDVAVAEHEVVGIIGANGAGKTTFVNMVTGYVKPSAGQIFYEGKEITALAPREVTRIGICRSFQVPQVFMSATVFDNLLISLGVAERDLVRFWRPMRRPHLEAEAERLMRRFQIDAYADQAAMLLPQGVRKMLDIAMAVVHRPRLLLLDEPTSGVSVEEKFGVMDTIMAALREQRVTVLFVEHDMEIVTRYAQRVLAFYEGAIVADGPPEQVMADEQVRRYVTGEALPAAAAGPSGGAQAKPEIGDA